MKITYHGSACVMIEHRGTKVLCDPWFTPGAYYGSWYQPPGQVLPDVSGLDYIYISHVHPDHFDSAYLSTLDKNIAVIICEYEEKFLRRQIEKIGFNRIIELPNQTMMRLNDDFAVEMFAADDVRGDVFGLAYKCKPIPNYKRTVQIDSIAVFSGGGRAVVNLNDVPIGLAQVPCHYILNRYRHIDVALLSYAGAGPFPQSYNFDHNDMGSIAVNVALKYLTNTTVEFLKRLHPDVYIPFAGGYILGGKNAWMNKYKGVAELDDLEQDLVPIAKNVGVQGDMLILESGGSYDVSRGDVTGRFKRTDFAARDKFIETLKDKPFDFDCDPEPGDLDADFQAAYPSLLSKQKRYDYFSDWSVLADLGDSRYRIHFNGNGVERVDVPEDEKPMLYCKIDKKLMKRILDRKANWNNAEVGSHILLHPRVPAGVPAQEAMVHHLMAYFQGAAR